MDLWTSAASGTGSRSYGKTVDNSDELPTAFPHCSPLAHKLHSFTSVIVIFVFSFQRQQFAQLGNQNRPNSHTPQTIATEVAIHYALLALKTSEDGELDPTGIN